MIVDSSALIAILRGEPEARAYSELIGLTRKKLMAAPTYLETCMVFVSRKGHDKKWIVDELLQRSQIEMISFTSDAASVAVDAFLKYGKGRGHPANLNFGDCISYAVSRIEAMPLLFKGDDFRHTDVECAL
jgi:ribonuclease VapC